jgi:hypothetical protein
MHLRSLALALGLLAASAFAAPTVTPGMWESTSTITALDAPNLPPAVQAQMKRSHTIRHCITPEQAAKGPEEVLKGNKSCQTRKFTLSGGMFDVDMVCQSMTMHSQGRFTPTSYSSTGTMTMSGGGGMTMSFSGTGKLVGPCQ